MSRKTVFSGIQPSGDMSLGNYLGALKRFGSFQTDHDSLFCIVDLHAITVRQDPQLLKERTYAVAAWYLACGLDPNKVTLFVQSQVHAHAEMAWLLNTFTQMGELERMTQFKDKAQRHKHNINAGLFSYPALMAADILLYDTHEVPVGDDQTQHIELTRNIAERVNHVFDTDIFVVPEMVKPKTAARVMDLQEPTRKMSKSDEGQGTVFMHDADKTIEKKIKRAVTDNLAEIKYDREAQPGVANLLEIHAACLNHSMETVAESFAGKGYGDLKKAVAEAVVEELRPVKEEFGRLMDDKAEIEKILHMGATKAAKRADAKTTLLKEKLGFIV